MSLIFHELSFEKWPWPIDFAKIFSNCGKKVKTKVTKFGSHSLSGFTVAANTMVVWDKMPPPPPVGNRVKAPFPNGFVTLAWNADVGWSADNIATQRL